jgi:endonuclease/exonuclease/phosphatase family metal-dependent hydrolase
MTGLIAAATLSACAHLGALKEIPEARPEFIAQIQKTRSENFKVLTQNVATPFPLDFKGKNKEKHESAIQEIMKEKPDFAFLQEVVSKREIQNYENLGYSVSHSPQNYVVNPSGLLILSRKKPAETQYIPYEDEGNPFFEFEQFSDMMLHKGMLIAFFPEDRLAVINTHMVSTYDSPASKDETHLSQTHQFIKTIQELKMKGWKIIAGGDFNCTPKDPQYAEISKELTDITAELGETFEEERSGKTVKQKLDYIWSSKGEEHTLRSSVAEVLGRTKSDHNPVMAKVLIPGAASAMVATARQK